MTLPAHARRPLFVPPGIAIVRTGPTTRAEFERLFEAETPEISEIRVKNRAWAGRSGLLRLLADALRRTPGTRAPRPF